MVAWRVVNDRRSVHYHLVARHSCDPNSNGMVLFNRTKQDTIILESQVISNFALLNLTVYDEGGDQYEDLFLESFRFSPGSKYVILIIKMKIIITF